MNKPKNVAFFFQLEPGQKLAGEGIAQYSNRVMMGYCELGAKVDIYFPSWARPQMNDFIEWSNLPKDLIKTHSSGSIMVTLLHKILYGRSRTDHETLIFNDENYAPKDINDILISNAPILRIIGILWPLAIILSPILLPLLLILLLTRRFLRGGLRRIVNLAYEVFKYIGYSRLAAKIDNNKNVETCVVPIGNWHMCRLIKKTPIAVQIPDIVWLDFPQYFKPDPVLAASLRKIKKVADHSKAIFCPSEYVKDKHLIGLLGVDADKVHVTHHGPMCLDEILKARYEKIPTQTEARELLAKAIAHAMDVDDGSYALRLNNDFELMANIRNFANDSRPIIYYPTQYRPYKNIEGLMAAIAEIKQKYKKSVRLLLTANFSNSPKIFELIDKLDLKSEIILCPRLPQWAHGLAYCASDFAISASYFEGGFTFNFSEALSVGRACLVSDIAVTREILPSNLKNSTTFDPYNFSQLAEKILRTLVNVEKIYEEQKRFQIQRIKARNWQNVASDYWEHGK